MCGINGFISTKQLNEDRLKKDITLMNDLIIHRGPDDDGVYTDSCWAAHHLPWVCGGFLL